MIGKNFNVKRGKFFLHTMQKILKIPFHYREIVKSKAFHYFT